MPVSSRVSYFEQRLENNILRNYSIPKDPDNIWVGSLVDEKLGGPRWQFL